MFHTACDPVARSIESVYGRAFAQLVVVHRVRSPGGSASAASTFSPREKNVSPNESVVSQGGQLIAPAKDRLLAK